MTHSFFSNSIPIPKLSRLFYSLQPLHVFQSVAYGCLSLRFGSCPLVVLFPHALAFTNQNSLPSRFSRPGGMENGRMDRKCHCRIPIRSVESINCCFQSEVARLVWRRQGRIFLWVVYGQPQRWRLDIYTICWHWLCRTRFMRRDRGPGGKFECIPG